MCQLSVRRFRHSRWSFCVPPFFFQYVICFCCAPTVLLILYIFTVPMYTAVSLFKISLFAGIHATVYVYQCLFLCRAGVGVRVVGWLWLIPPAEVHTKLCSVDLPQCPCCCCPCCCLAACSSRIFFFFQSICCDHDKHFSKRISTSSLPGVI